MKTRNNLSSKQRNQLVNISSFVQPGPENGIVCDEIAFVVLMRICRDYAFSMRIPGVSKETTERNLIDRLEKFRIKYVERI